MISLTALSDAPDQVITATLADGSSVVLTFHYKLTVQRWFVDVVRGTYANNGVGLSTHKNLLRTWRDSVPFGLRVDTADDTDPFLLEDFVSGRVVVSVLDSTGGKTEVQDAEAQYFT